MLDPILSSLPFINRKQLDFEQGAKVELRISCQASKANRLKITGMTRAGLFTFQHTTVADSLPESENFRITDFPIWITVSDTQGVFSQGEVYVNLAVLINGDRVFELCSGFVFTGKSISFPIGSTQDPKPLGGFTTLYTGFNQAAGVEISDTVNANQYWKVKAVKFRLVASAAAANRRVHLVCKYSSQKIYEAIAPADQTANQTVDYIAAPLGFATVDNNNGVMLLPLPPDFIVDANATFSTETLNLQAGDDFAAASYFVEQFFSPQI